MAGVDFREWGLLASIDLFKCNPQTIRSKEKIQEYVIKLCDLIGVKRFGETTIVDFGQDEKVSGFSMVQLIETSLISGHFANASNNSYIDIFSCKEYDIDKAVDFSKQFFEPENTISHVVVRKLEPVKGETSRILENPRNWLFENFGMDKGRSLAIKVNEMLAEEKSPFQRIGIFSTPAFGKLMTIDGIVQLTEFDEFAYHEMISHPAINVKPSVEKVLIIGGGDGGAAREVLKYEQVKQVDLCDIDAKVIELSKKYFPKLSCAFKDKRLKVFNEDGFKFLDSRTGEYDLIIVDSTDPTGFAENLFKEGFFKKVFNALKDDGIFVNQLESMYYNPDIISKSVKALKNVFPILNYYYTLVPTYPSGIIGFGFASKKYSPLTDYNPKQANGVLKYYNEEIHKACFVLPEFAKKIIY